MARNVVNYTVTDAGRDMGKVFVLTEMPAMRGEAWATRCLLALMGAGVQLPEGFEKMGMAGLAEIGLRMIAGLKWETAKPLLDEMLGCVEFQPDPSKPQIVRALFEGDVEEITTLVKLRAEVWKIHTGFLKAVAPSLFAAKVAPAGKKRTPNT